MSEAVLFNPLYYEKLTQIPVSNGPLDLRMVPLVF